MSVLNCITFQMPLCICSCNPDRRIQLPQRQLPVAAVGDTEDSGRVRGRMQQRREEPERVGADLGRRRHQRAQSETEGLTAASVSTDCLSKLPLPCKSGQHLNFDNSSNNII
jgi:hypothetical protein